MKYICVLRKVPFHRCYRAETRLTVYRPVEVLLSNTGARILASLLRPNQIARAEELMLRSAKQNWSKDTCLATVKKPNGKKTFEKVV